MQAHAFAGRAIAAIALLFLVLLGSVAKNYDFRAFYCAGAAARQHADPYKLQPLYSCEQQQTYNDPLWRTKEAVPAPFPGYVIAAVFEPLSMMPYRAAARLWTLLLIAAVIASAVLLRAVTGLSLPLTGAAVAAGAGIASILFGEIVPLFLLLLCLTMLFAQQGRWRAAAFCAAGTLLEPHLGLPVCLALAIWAPKTRLALGLCAAGLSALWIAALGSSSIFEYLARVLPYQALSDITSDRQLSLSAVLHAAGMGDAWALRLGSWSYAVAAALGVAAAGLMARRYRDAAYLAAVPAAAALAGGVYLHASQMLAALPLALLLVARMPRRRKVLTLVLLLLAVPWMWIVDPAPAMMAVVAAMAIAWEGSRYDLRFTAASSAAVALFLAVLFVAAPAHAREAAPVHAAAAIDPQYPQASWAAQTVRHLSTGTPITWWRRVPTWGALIVMLAACGAASRPSRPLEGSQC